MVSECALLMQLHETALMKLEGICQAETVKLFAVRSYGLVATLRVSQTLKHLDVCWKSSLDNTP